ncbi:MAG: LamG domain-containing protein [Gemmatimonadota bacterium]|nr:LamG domain-containing protein [Gemmatimonadota bacterium]
MISRVVLMMTALSLLLTHPGVTVAQSPTIDRSNLVLELLFDGDARDTSGKGHHGEVFGPVSADDRFGQPNAAFAFDGKNDHIRVAPPPTLSSEAFTLSVWVKYDDDAFSRYWTNGVITQDSGGSSERRVFQLSAFGPLPTWHIMGRGRDPLITRPVGTSVWRHLAVTHDGEEHRLYMDGELHDQAEAPFPPHPQEPVYIGRKGSGEPDFYFKGVIDDVRIYTETLSPETILALTRENGWQPPALPGIEVPDPPESSIEDALVAHWPMDSAEMRDVSGSGLKTIVMGQPESIEGLRGGALRFDGSDDWAVVKNPSLDLLHYLTITCWIRGFDTDSEYSQVLWYGDGAWGQDPYSMSIQEGKVGFRVDDVATQWEVMTESAPAPDTWTFVAATLNTRANGLMDQKIYVNGVLSMEQVTEKPYRYIELGRMWLTFATFGSGWDLSRLDLDDVRLYNRPLSHREIESLFEEAQE